MTTSQKTRTTGRRAVLGTAIMNEFAKMRNLRVGTLVIVLFALTLSLIVYAMVSNPSFYAGTDEGWNLFLYGIGQGTLMSSPLLLAVLASRQVDIEHQGNGWLLSATSGATPGMLCRAKFIAWGVLTIAVTFLASLIGLGIATALLGTDMPVPFGRWTVMVLSMIVVNLVILAVQLLLAAKLENQLIGIGVGLLGVVFAMIAVELPTWAQHLLPWGYYALSIPAEYQDSIVVAIPPSSTSIALLGVVGAALFILATGFFDREEA